MLNASEKAYCLALSALRDKRYVEAAQLFDKAADHFENNQEFMLLRETNRLLLAVKQEIQRLEPDDSLVIEQVFSDGLTELS